MEFTITLTDEEELSDISYSTSRALADKIIAKVDIVGITKKAKEQVQDKKKKIIAELTEKLTSMDEFVISNKIESKVKQHLGVKLKTEIADELFRKLRGDSTFIANVSKQVIKGIK